MKKVHTFVKRSTILPKGPHFVQKNCHFLAVSTPNYKSRAYKHKQPYLFPCSRSSVIGGGLGNGASCLSNGGTAITLHSSLPRVNTISLGQTLSIKNLDPVADASTVLIYESDYPLRATPCSCKSGLSTHVTHDYNTV